MKVIVLGGAGDVGSRAVEDLAASEGVERVTVADRNLAAAEALAARLAGQRAVVKAAAIDANDRASVIAAMEGHHIAASALGPFFRYEAPLASAAIEAGLDYCSVCDEWDAIEAVFDELSAEARETGRVVLTGLGTSPGFTNIGVRYLSRRLDSIHRVEVYVYQPLDAGGGEAVMRHMLHIMTGDIALWRDGRRTMVPACGESRVVQFPQFGPIRVWTMGHAEPVTVPRYFEGVQDVKFMMGYGRGARVFVQPARAGLFRSRRLTNAFVRGLLAIDRLSGRSPPAHGAIRVDVWGKLEGREVCRMLCGTGEMRDATGLALSIGAQMLGRGELLSPEGGVYAPEGCLEPDTFITAARAKGLLAYSDLGMTQPLG